MTKIFKILPQDVFSQLEDQHRFMGWRDDLRDGFIHCSTAEQLTGTLMKHFDGYQQLVVLEFSIHNVPHLTWEPSRDGQDFPHIYGPLDMTQADQIYELSRQEDGSFPPLGIGA